MSLIDKVRNNPLYRSCAEKLSDEDREKIENDMMRILEGYERFISDFGERISTDDGFQNVVENFDHLTSEDGVKGWQEKN